MSGKPLLRFWKNKLISNVRNIVLKSRRVFLLRPVSGKKMAKMLCTCLVCWPGSKTILKLLLGNQPRLINKLDVWEASRTV